MKKKISYNEHKKFEDDNILVFGKPFNLVSIYDDRVYDRSDADFMNTSMRSYFKERLTELQYDWLSGNVLGSPLYTTTFIFPKNGILGASPFDITRFEKRCEDDYFVLTPTQVAAYLIKFKCGEGILENLKKLISYHPINLEKLKDHLSSDKTLEPIFNSIYVQLKNYQSTIIKSEKLMKKSRIGRIL